MHLDPILPALVALVLSALVAGMIMRRLGQPFVIGCVVVGVLLGSDVLAVLEDADTVSRFGAIGVVLLLFFIGLETSPPRLVERWRVAILGTALQIALSVGSVALVGWWLDWPLPRVVLIGFVISLSSTAVLLKLLKEWRQEDTPIGRDVIAILITQDVAIVPMVLVVGVLSGSQETGPSPALQALGAVGLGALLGFALKRGEIRLPLARWLGDDDGLRVFAALAPCLVLALVTGLLGLSTGLGAFVGGMLVSMTRDAKWIVESLKPFEIVFTAIFFVSVGMILDLAFLRDNVGIVCAIVGLVLLTNTGINGVTLRLLGRSWSEALVAGALLAQIGEFSFVLAAIGRGSGLITEYGFQITISTIAISLALSPIWVGLVRRIVAPSRA